MCCSIATPTASVSLRPRCPARFLASEDKAQQIRVSVVFVVELGFQMKHSFRGTSRGIEMATAEKRLLTTHVDCLEGVFGG